MAVTSGQVSCTSAAPGTLILPAPNPTYGQEQGGYQQPNRNIFLANAATATVFVGPSGVTTATGYPLLANGTMNISLHLDEALYGIVASTASVVSFVASGS
jgi:hypothetical protein